MMFIKKMSICLLVSLFMFSACNTDDLIDLNDDPTSTNEIDRNYIFTLGILLRPNLWSQIEKVFIIVQ